jgi:hypothetical protein
LAVTAWLALSVAASSGAGIVILLSLFLSLRDELQELREELRARGAGEHPAQCPGARR